MHADKRSDNDRSSLEMVVEKIHRASAGRDRVTIGEIAEHIGQRSFGIWLLLAGLITLAPLVGDIPGVPTMAAALVLLIAVQLFMGRDRFWFPEWLASRGVDKAKVDRAVEWSYRPTRFVDRFIHPRLTAFVEGKAVYGIAGVCLATALLMPVMELVPFSANGAGAALTAFGLALTARDGVMAIMGYIFALGIFIILVLAALG